MALSGSHEVELSGDLTIRSIAEVHAALSGALEAHDAVVAQIDAGAEVDLTFAQLLVSARCTALAAGKTLALAQPAAGQLLEILNRGGFLADANSESRGFWLAQPGFQ
ncbi:MAG: STAS domain-containing protein [Phenylobacterium sp.]|uniref:STAS domain-containing protein n=1 Tax=Phenylobacterium sp. TaxID=1871053 RepID=UPI0025DDA67D|nr:STAS domain-containing protein [Phenylobacterium sp.]MBI1199721.1 STAS domain-containing protein [Phenylobacterium sp.]